MGYDLTNEENLALSVLYGFGEIGYRGLPETVADELFKKKFQRTFDALVRRDLVKISEGRLYSLSEEGRKLIEDRKKEKASE